MLDEEFYTWFAEHHKKPHFTFPEIPPAGDIVFEKLTGKNAAHLLDLFKNDDSPFVDERFKDADEAADYARYLTQCGAYSAKYGSADWLFRFKDGKYIGVLHLYDLSLETFAQNHKRAWIGFATGEEFRRQGITTKIVRHFVQAVFDYYPVIDYVHAMTDKVNIATANFLKKCGFLFDSTERMSEEDDFFILTRVGLS